MTQDVIDNIAEEIDLLRDIYVQSDNVPPTLYQFIDELAIGDLRSDLPPDAHFGAGGAAGFLQGLASGMGTTLMELLSRAGFEAELQKGPEESEAKSK